MLTPTKKNKLALAVKAYTRKYLNGKHPDLDESGTRIMINHFLSEVLGFLQLEEVKTEHMIKGTYADYMIQVKGTRHFLVEVKALSIALSDKHLRQAINYGANEGVEWALLTNGRQFDLYKILFTKPIESRKVFSIDLDDALQVKGCIDMLQFLHRDSVISKGLDSLWSKAIALDPRNIAGMLYAPTVVSFLRRELNGKYKCRFKDEEIEAGITTVIAAAIPIESVKPAKTRKEKKIKLKVDVQPEPTEYMPAFTITESGELKQF